jgi:gamma-glutamylaminecyclotransferase
MATKIAVYGTLRAGEANARLMKRAKFVANARTPQRYTMRSMGGFPCVSKNGASSIAVELYEVDDETLGRLDDLEGHPNWYEREIVDTTEGPAWMYLMPSDQRYEQLPVIKSGDWSMRHES